MNFLKWIGVVAFLVMAELFDDPLVRLDWWQTIQALLLIGLVISYAESFRKQ